MSFNAIGVWIEFWTYWVYRKVNNLVVIWVLMYRPTARSLPPGDDESRDQFSCIGLFGREGMCCEWNATEIRTMKLEEHRVLEFVIIELVWELGYLINKK